MTSLLLKYFDSGRMTSHGRCRCSLCRKWLQQGCACCRNVQSWL